MNETTRRRPWLAALLELLLVGLGHLYNRRWIRAATWFSLVLTTTLLFVPQPELMAFAEAGELPTLRNVAPVFAVRLLGIGDAYRLAVLSNVNEDTVRCPQCQKPLDEDLNFCQWCTTRLPELNEA